MCAAQMTRVCSEEVEYIGWKSYGMLTQLVPVGSYCTWPNPLAALAVMDPVAPVVRSLMMARSPFGRVPRETLRLSPEFISRSRLQVRRERGGRGLQRVGRGRRCGRSW